MPVVEREDRALDRGDDHRIDDRRWSPPVAPLHMPRQVLERSAPMRRVPMQHVAAE